MTTPAPRIARCVRPGLMALLVALAGPAMAEPAPRLQLPAPVEDVGTVAVGEDLHPEFPVENVGGAPLVLRPGRLPPGVTVDERETTLVPGQRGRLRLTVDTWVVRGPVEVEVPIATNDPTQPTARFRLKVTVQPFVVAEPGTARYVFVRGGEPGTLTQILRSLDGADFRVIGVRSPLPHLAVRYGEAVGEDRLAGSPGRQWRLDATIASASPVGPIQGEIVVRLDHPRQKAVRIPVSGFVRPMFAVTPPAATLGDVDRQTPRRLRLSVKNFGDDLADLVEVTTDLAGLHAEAVTLERGRTYALQLQAGPGLPDGPFQGTVRIRTSTPRHPLIEVPVTGSGRTR